MKKKAKKLVLNRETLAQLDQPSLRLAAAGTGGPYPTEYNTCVSFTCQPPYGNCQYSDGQNTCFTCAGSCTSNYC
jgi:hypothetical protein